MSQQIVENIIRIKERITIACENSYRDPKDVKLLLATKTVSEEYIEIALNAGHILIAENKVQELKEKFEKLKKIPHTNHFIGHLQSNKIKDLIKYNVTCIQSLDRLSLAEKLHQHLEKEGRVLDVLIQVNTSFEDSKFGMSPRGVIELVRQVAQFDTIKIKGLMTIGLLSTDNEKVRRCFRLLKDIQKNIEVQQIPNVQMIELSMGMSGDLEIAVEEGATIVRVGTAIFGQRSTPNSFYWNEGN